MKSTIAKIYILVFGIIFITTLPVLSQNSKTHTVKKGETLLSICLDNNILIADLISANAGKTSNLKVGQILIIPSNNQGKVTSNPKSNIIKVIDVREYYIHKVIFYKLIERIVNAKPYS